MDGRGILKTILDTGGDVRLIVDQRQEGACTPDVGEGHLVLDLEIGNPHNNQDLELTPWGMAVTLSFNQAPFRVRLPYSSILRIITEYADVRLQAPLAPAAKGLRLI